MHHVDLANWCNYNILTHKLIHLEHNMNLNIDWTLLAKQKAWLLDQDNEMAQGLVNFIDQIQDYYVDENLASEQVVFGNIDLI